MDIGPIGAIIVSAMTATKVVDGLTGKALGGKSGPRDHDLAMFIAVSGVCGSETRHFGSKS